ncbi:MAG: biopolymer transporter ExbD [Planctomycetes bacterium]|nr:biopolymer transporter ExbD [Planctomycetota bacterium]
MSSHSRTATSRPPDVEEATSLNLVPMVDIMFLMLLFFMLGSDMGQRELEDVVLPAAVSVKTDAGYAADQGRTTVNVYHDTPRGATCAAFALEGGICRDGAHWKVGVRGHDYDVRDELDLAKLRGLLRGDADDGRVIATDQVSERLVMIRADRAAPYGAVQHVMNLCAEFGIYRIEAGAAQAAPDSH